MGDIGHQRPPRRVLLGQGRRHAVEGVRQCAELSRRADVTDARRAVAGFDCFGGRGDGPDGPADAPGHHHRHPGGNDRDQSHSRGHGDGQGAAQLAHRGGLTSGREDHSGRAHRGPIDHDRRDDRRPPPGTGRGRNRSPGAVDDGHLPAGGLAQRQRGGQVGSRPALVVLVCGGRGVGHRGRRPFLVLPGQVADVSRRLVRHQDRQERHRAQGDGDKRQGQAHAERAKEPTWLRCHTPVRGGTRHPTPSRRSSGGGGRARSCAADSSRANRSCARSPRTRRRGPC